MLVDKTKKDAFLLINILGRRNEKMEESNKMMISAKYVEFLCAQSGTKSDEQKNGAM